MKPKDLLKNIKEQYDRLAEVSPLLPMRVIADFKAKFSTGPYADISKPEEANGLEEIVVYLPSKDRERLVAAVSPTPPSLNAPPPRVEGPLRLSITEAELLDAAHTESRGTE
jgi:hypothetical protein